MLELLTVSRLTSQTKPLNISTVTATCVNTKSFDVEPSIHTYASTYIRTAKMVGGESPIPSISSSSSSSRLL